ncbi:hypothetical protein FJT64_017407 [Amphibalanus amphitrite]|uniref:Nuclease HARBI1 n=1 Tax=Amphibalanus amphitrite TaxID=1232801 RepID=A0A6A4WWE0_AMPAM|nr:hypothetical protein FJT64_017407 [Amphibalanus amphitrite]
MELNIARIALSTTRIRVEQERRRARRRYWVAEVLQRRQARGEFFNLVQELRAVDPDRHHAYFRMSRETFDLLLAKIGPSITRQCTNFREPIDPAQRLAVTLRYLASGMEFSALAPCYRLGEKTVRAIVYDTCAAIIAILGPEADSQQPQQADASGEQVGGLCELGRLGANNFTREAERIRDQFARYFMAEGAVPWQDAAVGQ